MRRNVWGVVLVTIVALGGLGLVGYNLYQAGYRQGLIENGAEVVGPMFGAFPGFFPFFPLFGILFFFLFIGLISRVVFGHRGWWGPPRWTRESEAGYDSPMERRLDQWHERAHHSGGPGEREDTT